jgi:hypothetical protein
MKATTLSVVVALIPGAVFAQASGQAQASAQGTATVQSSKPAVTASATTGAQASADYEPPKEFSADGKAKLVAMFSEARTHQVPQEPMKRRVSEGRAKGASEAAVVASTAKVKANMEATQSAMITAGRKHPSDAEIEHGANAMERGATSAQIGAAAKQASGDRSLVAAFDALATVGSGASVTGAGQAGATGSAANGASAAAGATTAASGTAAGVKGAVSGTVGGALKKP